MRHARFCWGWLGALAMIAGIGSPVLAQFSSSHMTLLAQMPNRLGATSHDIWGWTDPLDGVEYAMIGSNAGVEFYDLSIPSQPQYVGRWLTNGFDFKVYGKHAYSVRHIFDLTRLRDVIAPQDFVSDEEYFPSSFHNVFINEQTGYLYGSCPSIVVYDLQDPLQPNLEEFITGSCHDAMSVVYHGPDDTYAGREILFASRGNGALSIFDVEDKENITHLSNQGYGGAYSHQGWTSEDHRYFFLGDELDTSSPGTRTHVFDVQDLDDPEYLGFYTGPTAATDHNLYVKGDLLYMANYAAGVRIVQLHDPGTLDMEEIAYFDTFPNHDGEGFVGAFTVYPFFQSGTLIASDRQGGLFVMRLDLGNDADFDDDGVVGCADVDAMVAWLAADESNASFDLTNDGLLTEADLEVWRELAGEALFGPGATVIPGDANLDGVVDGQDYIAWNDHKFQAHASWCGGDFDANGIVDGQDFITWNQHKFTSSDQLRAVPEPAAGQLPVLLAWLLCTAALTGRFGTRSRRGHG